MEKVDYGYGEELDYGYGDPDMVVAEDDAVLQSTMIDDDDDDTAAGVNAYTDELSTTMVMDAVRRGPKRRCSVTKFSLESDDTSAQPTLLTAASVIDAMRNGTHEVVVPTTAASSDNDRRFITPQNSSDFCFANTSNDSDDVVDGEDNGPTTDAAATKSKKNGVLRILSLRRK